MIVDENKQSANLATPGPGANTIPADSLKLPPLSLTPYKKSRYYFAGAIALQIVLLLGLGAGKGFTLSTGSLATLHTVPVDPWDMFRGDYVVLRYDISTVASNQFFPSGEEVYVLLEKASPYWVAKGIFHDKPEVNDGQLALKGKIENEERSGKYRVHYGIEQHYVPEGTGHPLERSQLSVQVAIDSFGNSAIKSVSPEIKKMAR